MHPAFRLSSVLMRHPSSQHYIAGPVTHTKQQKRSLYRFGTGSEHELLEGFIEENTLSFFLLLSLIKTRFLVVVLSSET